jgi:mannose-1-phosphate guanylyltransferase
LKAESYAVIMAGGSGERFWPMSTPDRPKQFLQFLGGKSLLRQTVERIEPLIPLDRQIVVTGVRHAQLVQQEIPELPSSNLLCEPIGRNTAACIGLASLLIERRDPNAIMVALPADHHIGETQLFLTSVERAVQLAREQDRVVVIGVQPNRPETGYGYIQSGPVIDRDAYAVLQFKEKPDEETAHGYLESGNYFWNTGIFVWQNRTIQRLIQTHLPSHWEKLGRIRSAFAKPEYQALLTEVYPTIEKISIDYGVMEKEKKKTILMLHGRFDWDDLGSWNALDRILARDVQDNVVIGQHVGLDTSDCIIWGREGRVVATIGLRDLIIVETAHGLLVCPKARSQDIRDLLGIMTSTPRESAER